MTQTQEPVKIYAQSLYSKKQVAKILGLHITSVQKLIQKGEIPAKKIGNVYRVTGKTLMDISGMPEN